MRQTPLLLLVDDQPENLDVLVSYLANEGLDLQVATDGEQAIALAQEYQPDLVLLDVMMPGLDGFEVCKQLKSASNHLRSPVIFMSAVTDTQSKLKGFEAGAVDYIDKPLQREEVLARIRAHLTIQKQQAELLEKNNHLHELNRRLSEQIKQTEQAKKALELADKQLTFVTGEEAKRWGIDAFVGKSPAIENVLMQVRALLHAANTNVLVLGESGTGKELISRSIHFGSERKAKPFIAVNCSAIPSELADAEFFGHIKGAFTGALQERSGYFVQADGGTLFLDEIGDMPLALQAKLLRVLEDGLVTPIGGKKAVKVDVRIVAATNVDLLARVQEKHFRQDLFYRLASYQLTLPPLRQRSQDIPLLVQHFLQSLSRQMGRETPGLDKEAMDSLCAYQYPGNVRELKNVIEYALIACQTDSPRTIQARHLHFLNKQGFGEPNEVLTAVASEADTSEGVACSPVSDNVSSGYSELNSSKQEELLLDFARTQGRIDNTSAQSCLGVSHGRASYLLKKLHKEGLLTKHGERRWAYYQLSS